MTSAPDLYFGEQPLPVRYVTLREGVLPGRLLDGREWSGFPTVSKAATSG